MKKIVYSLLLIVAGMLLADDVEISATNTIKFGSGSEWAGDAKDIEVEKLYLEDWLDMELTKGNFTAGIRFEAADSSEYNESIKDITKRYFQYSNNDLTITAGDFYGTFGRGLVLDLKEEKADFFDNKLTGGKIEYEADYFSTQILGGKSYFKYINDYDPLNKKVEQMNNAVYGGETNLYLSEMLKIEDYSFGIGGSYLFMEGDYVPETQYLYSESFIEKTEIGAFSVNISAFDFDFYNEYALKNTYRDPSKKGWANYSSLSFAKEGFGITMEFKDYYQYGANPNNVVSGFSAYQDAPEVTIDHVSHLLKTHPHEINANDEIGYKLSMRATVFDELDLTSVVAVASKHEEDKVLPNFDDEYLPYYDSWVDGRFGIDKFHFVVGGGYYYDSPLSKGNNRFVVPEEDDDDSNIYTMEMNTYMLETSYELNSNSALKFGAEFQTIDKAGEEFEDYYTSVEYSYPEYGYFNVSLIKTSEDVSGDTPDSWLGFEAGMNILERHKLELFYGRERSGIKCSGGACRQVPEFDGFKMTLVSTF